MKHSVRWLLILVLLMVAVAGCDGDDETDEGAPDQALATDAPTAAAATPLPTDPPASSPEPIDTVAPPPTSTTPPTPTVLVPAAATIIPGTPGETTNGQSGQSQDASVAATTAAAAGQAQSLMAPWQGIIGVAVMNQAICGTLQQLAQTGQQGGLGALAVTAGLGGAGGVLQTAQQQLGGLINTPGLGPLAGSLQADQSAMGDVIGRWSGGQMDAAAAGAALPVICGATDATLAQTQQGAQTAGLSAADVAGLLEKAKREAGGLLGGLLP